MKRTQIGFAMVVVAIALTVTAASAQDKGKRGFGGRGGGGAFGGSTLLTVATNEAVQKEVGISGDQKSKLTSLQEDYRAARQKEFQKANINLQDFQNISADQRQKMAQIGRTLDEEFNPKIKEVVGADSFKRLKQIELQYNLSFRGPGALTYADVAAELKLTDDQKKKLTDMQAESDGQRRGGGGGGNFDAQAFAKRREERTAKTLEVLTSEQKEKLETLKGSAFDVSQLGFGGGTGRRGKGN